MELIGPYLIGCALLVAAGVAKAVRPADTARALGTLVAVPQAWIRRSVRVGAAAEALLGTVAILFPRAGTAWLVALSYAAFAVVVTVARTRGGPIASCGCFGTPDTPATYLHVLIDAGLCAAAAAVAVSAPAGSIVSILAGQPLHGLPLAAVSALGAWLVYLALSALAGVQAARKLTAVSFGSEA